MGNRWSVEQVEAIAPSPAAISAARPLATPSRWARTGADDRAVWGSCQGSGAEPYDTVVDHGAVATRCTCPSRRLPCKHALALLLLWCHGQVPDGVAPDSASAWVDAVRARSASRAGGEQVGGTGSSENSAPATGDVGVQASVDGESGPAEPEGGSSGSAGDPSGERGPSGATIVDPALGDDPSPGPDPDPPPDRSDERDERIERMRAGLVELDRWLDDRIRTGLADPALARYSTWDGLAARLVDARAGSLANRIRRLAGRVGATPDWHDHVLAELGVLHLLARAGLRLGDLPEHLADGVATTVGWQVKQADVLAGVPETDDWIVAARSDVREDRIEVRRHWLRGRESGRWALVLSFAAYRQSLDTSLAVGTAVRADLHRYPGGALRCLVGRRHGAPEPTRPPSGTVADLCDDVGAALVDAPWLDRVAATVTATPASDAGRWWLTDATGSLPLLVDPADGAHPDALDVVLASSVGAPVDVTVEWTPAGLVPLAVHGPESTTDIGPRADPSFVGAA